MIARTLLHGLRVALALLLVVQVLQVISALRLLDGGAVAASPQLLPALLLKLGLLVINALLLVATHRALRRRSAAAAAT